jgi:hypothetical protein
VMYCKHSETTNFASDAVSSLLKQTIRYLYRESGVTWYTVFVIWDQQFHCVAVISVMRHPVLESAGSAIGFPSSQQQQEVRCYLLPDKQHRLLIVVSRALSLTPNFGPPLLTLIFSRACLLPSNFFLFFL